jgi:threonine dehydrogenase-like Zn-dependent dehydrogenase
MRALTVVPTVAGSAALVDLPDPEPAEGAVLLRTLAVGVCGTDHEILDGAYGEAPPGRDRLVLGHESLAEVVEAPRGAGLARGDRVVAMVRHPDPVPCASCAVGEWDMCRNGRFTEHGIKGRDGFLRERFRAEPARLVRVDPALGLLAVLLEPASVLAKAWEQIERIGARAAAWGPRRVLVTGAGPIGLLAALMGVQRGLDVHVLDRVTEGPKPALVRALGATYHSGRLEEACAGADVLVECTGSASVVLGVLGIIDPVGIVCLTGVSSGGRRLAFDVGAFNRELVLENDVVFGTVNANRRHYEQAHAALARADRGWLGGLVSRVVPLERWREALERGPADVKPVIAVAPA